MRGLRALRLAALRLLIALALLVDLFAWPTPSDQVSSVGAATFAASHAADEGGDPAPPTAELAAPCADHADGEHGLLPQPPPACAPRLAGADAPDIAPAAPTRPHGPDPRPPLA